MEKDREKGNNDDAAAEAGQRAEETGAKGAERHDAREGEDRHDEQSISHVARRMMLRCLRPLRAMTSLTTPLIVVSAIGFTLDGPAACTRSAAIGEAGVASARPAAPDIAVPVRYDEHRWIVRPVTTAGDTLDLYTDSGGGFLFIARERLGPDATAAFAERTPAGDSMFTAPWLW